MAATRRHHDMSASNRYALITAARNEEAYIGATILSVTRQSILPVRWVIVDDDSSDRTYDIISEYAEKNAFILPVHLEKSKEWSFKSKANAVNFGHQHLKDLEYDFLGILDADITFDESYYERILDKFSQNPRLGLAGGIISEMNNGKYVAQSYYLNSVAGAIQLFRRECFEQVGGYIPSKRGGIDAIAEMMTRMHGWHVQSFPEITVNHLRPTGLTKSNIFKSRFIYGQRDYALGNHPLFMFLKCIHRFQERPYVVAGLLRMIGYGWSWIRKEPRPIPESVVAFIQREQIKRMRSFSLYEMKGESFKHNDRVIS